MQGEHRNRFGGVGRCLSDTRHLGSVERAGVDRHVGEIPGEVVTRGPVRPCGQVVTTESPVTAVSLSRGGSGVTRRQGSVDVEGHPRTGQGGDHLMPVPVVVRRR